MSFSLEDLKLLREIEFSKEGCKCVCVCWTVTGGDFPVAIHPELCASCGPESKSDPVWSIDRIDLLRCSFERCICVIFNGAVSAVWMIFKSVTTPPPPLLRGDTGIKGEEETVCACVYFTKCV